MSGIVLRRLAVVGVLLFAAAASAHDDVARVLAAARAQVGVTRTYDAGYRKLAYPGGDVPADRGVCSDVVVRAWRAAGIDLQVELHRDMRRNFSAYPKTWRLARPDPNIDHRRVPNLETWLRRRGSSIAVTVEPADYRAGDLVSWRLDQGQPHIGIVSDERSGDGGRPLIVHNIGAGTQLEDVLFGWPISGHFRYFPAPASP